MTSYILRRLLLMIPTLLGIMTLNFIIIQSAPGGPVEQAIAKIQGIDTSATRRVDSGVDTEIIQSNNGGNSSQYRGAQGLPPELVEELEQLYGFDKPLHERYFEMLGNYLRFDFGDSFYRDSSVVDLILEKMPVSISLGLWTTLLVYGISIPLGIRKAVQHGSRFDIWSSTAVTIGFAIPNFLFAIMLIVLFAGGSYWDWFPLRGLTSSNWDELSLLGKVGDYFWHLTLPVTAMVISSFATLTMLTKNSFLDEINKQYVLTARAKGLTENRVLYGHVFRNAMLLVISSLPATLISIFLTGSFMIEVIFSLDGLGLLGFEAVVNRDYPVVFGTLYMSTLIGLVLKLISDITYTMIDPRINFEGRQ
ncbi:ABC transporter permease [Agarivorans sp. OAG1]|uniref:Inner membrane ABC transporter permease protein YejB n=1 Tax=Agarivorans albus MKT 106 TaxID=1331007 RepID=R9PM90_AGAAL|nr:MULTISPECIES: microcin C ABC transporter permease YejB [Agarivorans]MPW28974.1 microcin C ABC transporter permease YejB [Agarivorans sp. B2Z047]UQN41530.1 microcin C ABC transporter permease YejB [Agarivorans sp. B2Z047]BEU02517.1 ABC transporter permease [Agarivorans sp. OAG1]GAD02484.1 oligopeptide transport system permease protein OppB [Agarivorans albus MKT 106]